MEVPAVLARAEEERRQHAEREHDAKAPAHVARRVAQPDDEPGDQQRQRDHRRSRVAEAEEVALRDEARQVAAPVGE